MKERKLTKAEQDAVDRVNVMARHAINHGCPADQLKNFLRAGVVMQEKGLEIAARCRECDRPDGPIDVLAGGGRGCGKTHSILAQIFCDDCQRVPGLKVLVLRKVGRSNKEQINDFRKKLLHQLPHTFRDYQQNIEFENGSIVFLGNFKDEKDIDKYLGLEYDLIHIVESNQLTETKKTNILSCLRTNKTNWKPRCYEDTNPGGIGHAHNKRIFVDPWKKGKQTTTRYIHCVVEDNAFVDPGYKKYLEGLKGWQYEAWYKGSWDFMAGAFFQNFHYDGNVYPNPQMDLNERAVTRWFAGLDYGFTHPTAFTLCCETENGDFFAVDEYQAPKTTIEDHCAAIRDLLALHNLRVEDLEFIAAGNDCFRMDKEGGTVAKDYSELGVDLTAVQIDRINAWSQMLNLMGDPDKNQRPRFYVHKNCFNLIEQIQMAQHDEKKPEDIQKFNANPETGEGGDDQLDSCRNACVMAYNSILTKATPIQMGNYQSPRQIQASVDYIDVDVEIRESEELDIAQNQCLG